MARAPSALGPLALRPTISVLFMNGPLKSHWSTIAAVWHFSSQVDGNWGPYEYCNPVKNDDARGGFSCRADMSAFNSRAPKPECACARMNVTVGRWNRSISGYNGAFAEHLARRRVRTRLLVHDVAARVSFCERMPLLGDGGR